MNKTIEEILAPKPEVQPRIYAYSIDDAAPNVAACHAMANLLAEKHNTFWHDYEIVVAAGASAGIGLEALPPVRKAIGSGFDTKTITLRAASSPPASPSRSGHPF